MKELLYAVLAEGKPSLGRARAGKGRGGGEII